MRVSPVRRAVFHTDTSAFVFSRCELLLNREWAAPGGGRGPESMPEAAGETKKINEKHILLYTL